MSLRGACKATRQSPLYKEIASGKERPRNDMFFYMKPASILSLALFFLASCAPAPTPQSLPTSTATFVVFQPTFTVISPTTTFAPAAPTQTSIPIICDPHTADYCITDGHFIFQRPIKSPGNTSVDVTYRYASTANGTRDPHHGVEFINKFGTPVYAAGDGVVAFAGPDSKAMYSPWPNYYGNVVVIKHANDLYTLYAHLSKILVETGKSVRAGDEIGEVGQSGVAIGSHLHFEVRRGNAEDYFSTQNPELWLLPNQDKNGQPFGVIQISAVNKCGPACKACRIYASTIRTKTACWQHRLRRYLFW